MNTINNLSDLIKYKSRHDQTIWNTKLLKIADLLQGMDDPEMNKFIANDLFDLILKTEDYDKIFDYSSILSFVDQDHQSYCRYYELIDRINQDKIKLKELELVHNHLKYMPGSSGFMETKEHFDNMRNKNLKF